jgi:hypothetical protein
MPVLNTGMRYSEIRLLQWKQMNLGNPQKLVWDPPRILQSRRPVKLEGSTKRIKRNGSSGRTRINT